VILGNDGLERLVFAIDADQADVLLVRVAGAEEEFRLGRGAGVGVCGRGLLGGCESECWDGFGWKKGGTPG
jgi:hypothetical protein